MTHHAPQHHPCAVLVETREQAARSISLALEFLSNEADSIGLFEVSLLIERARAKTNELLAD
ncbi:MAG TPA: hypothetical protein VE175_00955 [Woeseiaceae bacterium]|jgi:hypothetical protein|nr:hypothetical protein [Woeseiaceae bacterium]